MQKSVLILTPSLGLGELVRQVLEDTGGMQSLLFNDPEQAWDAARQDGLDLLVLDVETGPDAVRGLVEEFRAIQPQLDLIVLPSEEDPEAEYLDDLHADHILPTPFYLPHLVSAVENLYGPMLEKSSKKRTLHGEKGPVPTRPERPADIPPPEWLQDVSQAAQYLTRLSLESASQASLITKGREVWAYAGELPQAAAEELATAVAHHSDNEGGADLARFVHLEATSADYMLYATGLGGEFTLAMVFDAEMPFSQMRAQAGELANALATAPEQAMAAKQGQTIRTQSEIFDHEDSQQSAEQSSGSAAPGWQSGDSANAESTSEIERTSTGNLVLKYAYLLVPRMPNHKLEGDLARRLAEWMPQLCVAFDWRLDHLDVKEKSMHWMVSMRSSVAPETVVSTLREELSKRIFAEFPRLEEENPSGEFWANGFFILNGTPPSNALIADYIQQTRADQGLSKNS